MRIADLAKKLGVSTATVSRALGGSTAMLVTEPLRSRIQAMARKEHFVPNPMARSLAQGRSNTIGVILYTDFGSHFFNDYLGKVQGGLMAAMADHPALGCQIHLLPRGKTLSDAGSRLLGSGVDGLLIVSLSDFHLQGVQEPVYAMERHCQKPIVALNIRLDKKSRVSTVDYSNYQAASLAVKHLIRKGHRYFGLIYTDDGAPDVAERVSAFKAALGDHELAFNPHFAVEGAYLVDSGYDAAIQLFKQSGHEKITALFCTNDEMAFGALRALRVLRKRCPQEVAVMGVDGLDAGELVDPPLTTVSQPFFEIAKTGVKLLFDLIDGRQKKPAQLTVPAALIVRDSA